MRISIHSRRFDFSTADLRKLTTKHKAKYKKGSDGLLPIKMTCAKFSLLISVSDKNGGYIYIKFFFLYIL
jgi:hypothetical protein